MKFSESQQQLLKLAIEKAEHDAAFTVTSVRVDGILKGGGTAHLILEPPPPPPPPKPSSFGRVVAVLLCGGFVVFLLFCGAVGSQYRQSAPQHDETPVATPTPTPGK